MTYMNTTSAATSHVGRAGLLPHGSFGKGEGSANLKCAELTVLDASQENTRGSPCFACPNSRHLDTCCPKLGGEIVRCLPPSPQNMPKRHGRVLKCISTPGEGPRHSMGRCHIDPSNHPKVGKDDSPMGRAWAIP